MHEGPFLGGQLAAGDIHLSQVLAQYRELRQFVPLGKVALAKLLIRDPVVFG